LKFGLAFNTAVHGTDPELMVAAARCAEECGFEPFFTSEHIVMYPGAMLPGYVPLPPDLAVADPLACLTYVAAETSTLLLGTAVLLLPYYQPILLAKQLATIDVLPGAAVSRETGASETGVHAVGTDRHDGRGRPGVTRLIVGPSAADQASMRAEISSFAQRHGLG
jgi:hypothetical protein